MTAWWTKLMAVVVAACFPWLSMSVGGMVLCIDPCGEVTYSPGAGLVCAGAVLSPEASAAGACTQCLDEDGCVDIPGKGQLSPPAATSLQTRTLTSPAMPSWPAPACLQKATTATSLVPPQTGTGDPPDTACRLKSHATVVLRL